MTELRFTVASLCITILLVVFVGNSTLAGDYVWTRTAYGSSAAGRHCSTFSNGYGGYYVPQNAVGNNHEAQGNFKNPNGFIVPGQCNTSSPRWRWFH